MVGTGMVGTGMARIYNPAISATDCSATESYFARPPGQAQRKTILALHLCADLLSIWPVLGKLARRLAQSVCYKLPKIIVIERYCSSARLSNFC